MLKYDYNVGESPWQRSICIGVCTYMHLHVMRKPEAFAIFILSILYTYVCMYVCIGKV